MHIDEFIPKDLIDISSKINSDIGYNLLRNPRFWESWIINQLGGESTKHKCGHDAYVVAWSKECRAEIKFSNSFFAKFNEQKGVNYDRNCFKWRASDSQINNQEIDAFICVGFDEDDTVHIWIIPHIVMKKSFLLTAPSSRGSGHSKFDKYKLLCPFQLLPAFTYFCHGLSGYTSLK